MADMHDKRRPYVQPIVTIAQDSDLEPEGKITPGAAESLSKAPS